MAADAEVGSELLAAALSYAARGWAVFPLHTPTTTGTCDCRRACGSVGKHPRTRNGLKDASTDPAKIRGWWETWPAANVAIATGRGLVVLDVDGAHDGEESLADLVRALGPLPPTVECLTGSGRHLYFTTGVEIRPSAGVLGRGLDVRGDGGYVVAPPSLHRTGRRYAWEASGDPEEVSLAPLPPRWVERLTRKLRVVREPGAAGEAFPEGQRNDALFRMGRSLRARGLSEAAIAAALQVENETRCVPPLDPREVEAIARSAAAVPPGWSPEVQEEVAQREARRARDEARTRVGGIPQEDAPATAGGAVAPGDDWRENLGRTPQGAIRNTYANLCAVLRGMYGRELVFDQMRQQVYLGPSPVDDRQMGVVRERIERDLGFSPQVQNLWLALLVVGREREVHPVRDYLRSLAWDGTERLPTVSARTLGAPDPLSAMLVQRWFLGAAARALRPGCKQDTALVLVGDQGVKKSTWFATLASPWFTDTQVDLRNKDAFQQCAGNWIIEWGEIERVTSKHQAADIKSFLSSREDDFRVPYARSFVKVPRTSAVVGSTNQTEFLEDPTGSRRFWCVDVKVPKIDVETVARERDQLWAEAVVQVDAGFRWWLEAEEDRAREEAAAVHTVEDPWATAISRWLARQDRRDHTAEEVLSGALDIPKRDQSKSFTMRVGAILRGLGWDRRKHRPLRDGRRLEPCWCWFAADFVEQEEGEDAPYP